MSDPTIKFCLDYPQKWLQIFQGSGKAGRFGLVKPGHLPNFCPICLFLGGTFKIVIDIAKKKVQTFLYSTMFREVLWTPSCIYSPWCGSHLYLWFVFYVSLPKDIKLLLLLKVGGLTEHINVLDRIELQCDSNTPILGFIKDNLIVLSPSCHYVNIFLRVC